MAKIAVEFEPIPAPNIPAGAPARLARRLLACGRGWSVSDVLCTAGPKDRPFEEQHSGPGLAIVASGTFQYRSTAGTELMTPGSLLLGNSGQYFECGHEHAVADRCISFSYEPEYFESLAEEAGVRTHFPSLRVPRAREFSGVLARAYTGIVKSIVTPLSQKQRGVTAQPEKVAGNSRAGSSPDTEMWEEIGIELAVRALQFESGHESHRNTAPAAEARVTRIVRMIENRPNARHDLIELAREAKLSRYHFIRIFQQFTSLTPHQYVVRARLLHAATRLLLEPARVLDVALDSGFGDVSNFNHAFLAEFGVSPRSYRRAAPQPAPGPRS